jgi:hypothetical protein
MNDPRTKRHNRAVTLNDWWQRIQALSQSSYNRRRIPKFASQRPLMPPSEVKLTQAASAASRHRPTAPILPPTANQHAVQAHQTGPFVVGNGGYQSTTVPQALTHRSHTPRGPG